MIHGVHKSCYTSDLNVVLIKGKCEEADNANKNANILQEKNCECFSEASPAGSLHGFIEFRHHIDEGDVKEHATGEAKDVAGGALQLAKQDAKGQTKVAGACRQEVVHQCLRYYSR